MKVENNILYVSVLDDFLPFLDEHNKLSLYLRLLCERFPVNVDAFFKRNNPVSWVSLAFFWPRQQFNSWSRLNVLWQSKLDAECINVSCVGMRCLESEGSIAQYIEQRGTAQSEQGE